MGNMTRREVLEDMVKRGDGYPDASGIERTPSVGYSGWRWARIAIGAQGLGREWHLYREDRSWGAITPRDYEAHKARQQKGDPNAHESVRAPEQPAWDGEGLPPVGAVVEVSDGGAFDGREGKVQAIVRSNGGEMALLSIGPVLYGVHQGGMRPIRSDEDKEVDELGEVLEGIYDVMGELDLGLHEWIRQVAQELHAIGYRKTEGV